MNPNFRNFALWVIIFLLVVALVMLFQGGTNQKTTSREVAYSQLVNDVDQGRVREATISGQEITGHLNDNSAFVSYAPVRSRKVRRRPARLVAGIRLGAPPQQQVHDLVVAELRRRHHRGAAPIVGGIDRRALVEQHRDDRHAVVGRHIVGITRRPHQHREVVAVACIDVEAGAEKARRRSA